MKNEIELYTIQDWLFREAEGNFDIDLGESGIQYHYLNDLDCKKNHDLNYSLDQGKHDLRQIVATMYDTDPDNVIITHGSQEGLYLFYRCYLQPGDHVITFSPGWQQSWAVPKHIGADVSVIALDRHNEYAIDIDRVKSAIKSNTRLIILNSPNNPTGTKIPDETMQALIRICEERNIFLINDEEYLTDYTQSIFQKSEMTAGCSSLSKVYGFPGLRMGWFVAPRDIIRKMVNYKRYTTVTNSSLCEYFAIDILSNKNQHLTSYQNLLSEKLPLFTSMIEQLPQVSLISPQNTPYGYLILPDSMDSLAFSRSLLEETRVLVMPAEVFRDKHAIRLSFVRPNQILMEGLDLFCSHYLKQIRT